MPHMPQQTRIPTLIFKEGKIYNIIQMTIDIRRISAKLCHKMNYCTIRKIIWGMEKWGKIPRKMRNASKMSGKNVDIAGLRYKAQHTDCMALLGWQIKFFSTFHIFLLHNELKNAALSLCLDCSYKMTWLDLAWLWLARQTRKENY